MQATGMGEQLLEIGLDDFGPEPKHVRVGELRLWLRHADTEWSVGTLWDTGSERSPVEVTREEPPPDLNWMRWITGDGDAKAELRPVMPDRPVVVRPEMPVSLLPGQTVSLYVGVPLWVRLSVGTQPAQLDELPTVKLSNSWFGEPTEGELCYALHTHPDLSPDALCVVPHRAVCAIQVRNASTDTVTFERICVRCQHMGVFRGGQRYWTNALRLSYLGKGEFSRVVYGSSAPEVAGANATFVTPPRENLRRGLFKRSLGIVQR